MHAQQCGRVREVLQVALKHAKLPFDARQRQRCGHSSTALAGRHTAHGAPPLDFDVDVCGHDAAQGAGHLLCVRGLVNVIDRRAHDHRLHDDR